MSFSNRCFPTKAINLWRQTDDGGHVWIVGAYFKYSATWTDVGAFDITGHGGKGAGGMLGGALGALGGGDPMYVVRGSKPAA